MSAPQESAPAPVEDATGIDLRTLSPEERDFLSTLRALSPEGQAVLLAFAHAGFDWKPLREGGIPGVSAEFTAGFWRRFDARMKAQQEAEAKP